MKNIFLSIVLAVIFYSGLTAQVVPNGNFENWTEVNGVLSPDGWVITNIPAAPSITKETPGYNSSAACKISMVNYRGFVFASPLTQQFAFSENPKSLTGAFKILPQSGDSVSIVVSVVFTKNGEGIGGGGFSVSTKLTSSSFVTFIAPISYLTKTTPDSAYVSVQMLSRNQIAGSAIEIDKLEFSNITNVSDYRNTDLINNIYPNPVKDVLNIPVKVNYPASYKIDIYNLTGEKIRDYNYNLYNNQVIHIPVSDIESGAYFISFTSDNGNRYVKKFIVNR
jgi:hypothetical protein